MGGEKAVSEIERIQRIRRRLAELGTPFGIEARLAKSRPPVSPRKRKRKTNPVLQALRQQEIRYAGLVRGLTVEQKKKISRIREGRGIRAAITAAKRMGSDRPAR